jgi:hypothetical protein
MISKYEDPASPHLLRFTFLWSAHVQWHVWWRKLWNMSLISWFWFTEQENVLLERNYGQNISKFQFWVRQLVFIYVNLLFFPEILVKEFFKNLFIWLSYGLRKVDLVRSSRSFGGHNSAKWRDFLKIPSPKFFSLWNLKTLFWPKTTIS